MLTELLAEPGVEETLVTRSAFGFCALHGGLEQGTAEIAAAAAARAGASFYAVVQPDNLRWHVPSHRYDPAFSDALSTFVAHVEIAISVHGYGGLRTSDERWTTALLGGANRALAQRLGDDLAAVLPHYTWITDLEKIPAHLRGVHPSNPVNRVAQGGVQIELPPRVRRPGNDLDALIDVFSTVAAPS
jgi:phage replication-related protein YjqB (UPF0714/DUF867 family)